MKTPDQMMAGYSKLLAKDEWATFSTGVRSRKGNLCECCRISGRQTQVHHPFYDSKRKPWEYEDNEVVLLCTVCHDGLHEQLKMFRRFVFRKMSPRVLQVINGSLAVALDKYDKLIFAHALAEFVSRPGLVEHCAEKFGLGDKVTKH